MTWLAESITRIDKPITLPSRRGLDLGSKHDVQFRGAFLDENFKDPYGFFPNLTNGENLFFAPSPWSEDYMNSDLIQRYALPLRKVEACEGFHFGLERFNRIFHFAAACLRFVFRQRWGWTVLQLHRRCLHWHQYRQKFYRQRPLKIRQPSILLGKNAAGPRKPFQLCSTMWLGIVSRCSNRDRTSCGVCCSQLGEDSTVGNTRLAGVDANNWSDAGTQELSFNYLPLPWPLRSGANLMPKNKEIRSVFLRCGNARRCRRAGRQAGRVTIIFSLF